MKDITVIEGVLYGVVIIVILFYILMAEAGKL